jgi:hypothetical protein
MWKLDFELRFEGWLNQELGFGFEQEAKVLIVD